jgi:CDGSH-type Zn-finger protein
MILLDDNRCAYARFCHRDAGNVWELTMQDNDPVKRKEALAAALECPAGRLVAVSQNGEPLENTYEPEIIIMQDPEQGTSAGIFVKGPIVVESADGTEYEVRNRIVLCRCGESDNKPFCDASHINAGYVDKN